MEIISKIREKFITRKTGEIYRIVNKLNNLCYVGMTSGTSSLRWKSHISGYEKSAISKAILEYGINNFYFEVLEEVEISLDGFGFYGYNPNRFRKLDHSFGEKICAEIIESLKVEEYQLN